MSVPTVGEMMAAYAEDAVEHASERFGITLDYSPESVREVESILGKLYDSIPRTFLGRLFKGRPPTDEDIWSVCKMYGGYVGEVVRRHHGGEWIMDTEISPGEEVIALEKEGSRMFPPDKVGKRLTNGPEDDVWVYFTVGVRDHWPRRRSYADGGATGE